MNTRVVSIRGLAAAWLVVIAAPVFAETEQSAEGETEAAEERPLTVEEILNRDPGRDEYVEDDVCVTAARIKEVEVIDNRHVVFDMGRNKHYLVQFKHPCRDLHRNKPVFLERHSSRLCRQDRIWGARETGLGGYERGMVCMIPGFQSVSKEQVVLMKDALKAQKRREREARRQKRKRS